MGNTQQSIQDKQLNQIELPFKFQSIPKKILQTNDYLGEAFFYLDVHFYQPTYLKNNRNFHSITLEKLLQTIIPHKRCNLFKCAIIRNIEDYKASSNLQTSMQSDFQALLILLYFLSMNYQLYQLNINWKSLLPFQDFNEVMNLIASFQYLKSLVLDISCSQINNSDDHVFLRSFSSRISCQNHLLSLDLTLKLEEYNINSLEFLTFLTDLNNLQFLQTITLKFLSKVYSDISIDSLMVLSLHPSLKSISIQSNNLNGNNNNEAFQNKNISETYLNQLKSSTVESVFLDQFKIYNFNLLFAILTRLPFLKKFTIYSDYSTSMTDSLRFPIIPYKRNSTFPVLESIEIKIYSRTNVQIVQEVINGLCQFKTYCIQWFQKRFQGIFQSNLGLEKTLITISQGEIINLAQKQQGFEYRVFGPLGIQNSDLLNEYIFQRKSVCLSICAFKKILWRYMISSYGLMNNSNSFTRTKARILLKNQLLQIIKQQTKIRNSHITCNQLKHNISYQVKYPSHSHFYQFLCFDSNTQEYKIISKSSKSLLFLKLFLLIISTPNEPKVLKSKYPAYCVLSDNYLASKVSFFQLNSELCLKLVYYQVTKFFSKYSIVQISEYFKNPFMYSFEGLIAFIEFIIIQVITQVILFEQPFEKVNYFVKLFLKKIPISNYFSSI